MRRSAIAISIVAATGCLVACGAGQPSSDTSSPIGARLDDGTCEVAFGLWVEAARSLNAPNVDLVDALRDGEARQRVVFERCTLAEAERWNQKLPLDGTHAMIEPDMRTFAEVECVDESPLLDGTALCAEVGAG